MKLLKNKNFWILTSVVLFIGYIVSCTKNDQVLEPGTNTTNTNQ